MRLKIIDKGDGLLVVMLKDREIRRFPYNPKNRNERDAALIGARGFLAGWAACNKMHHNTAEKDRIF
jgi:hypothetical protein